MEYLFSTARSYLYYLNRLSGERWEKEQTQDAGVESSPVTLKEIEPGSDATDMKAMLANEYGRFDHHAMSDIDICSVIGKLCMERFGGKTVYEMSAAERTALASILLSQHRLARQQVARCVIL